ncbi:serine/threonine protein kinase, partial [Streptomyces sp. T-3]|nr:serine/threonine protein kinase [Streptomyces sp. T-3]
AVTVGSVFVIGLLPDGGGGGAKDAGSRPPAGAAPKTIPQRYLGTWEGDVKALGGSLPGGTVKIIIKQAKPGEQFGTINQTDLLGNDICADVLILKKASDKEILATGRPEDPDDERCTKGDHPVTFRPVGDDLQYSSDNPAGGNPEARLSRTK